MIVSINCQFQSQQAPSAVDHLLPIVHQIKLKKFDKPSAINT